MKLFVRSLRAAILGLVVIGVWINALPAFGHGVRVWAEVKDNRVQVEAYFSGGDKIKDARILVMDADDNRLLEGRTDDKGRFSFPPPNRNAMTIVLIVDADHQDEFVLSAEELAAVELEGVSESK